MLDGIAEIIGGVLENIYDPAKLKQVAKTYAENGDITETKVTKDVFIHPVARSEAYRQQAGFADGIMEVIVLASHIPDVKIDTDDEIVSGTDLYSVVRAKLDGPKSQWLCVCKETKGGA